MKKTIIIPSARKAVYIMAILLTGCATTSSGPGAIIGGTIAGLAGAGLAVATFGIGAPMIPAWVAAGAAIGGGSGAIVGGSTGYAVDYHKAGNGTYEYKIEQVKTHERIVIRQVEEEPLKKGSLVRLIWDKERRIAIPINGHETVIDADSNQENN
ncbi:MAG: hypothetical protein JSS50_03375 [Proteobacteria bacterium]|nr:hypothetical protein [Pseudomonadota bacterium]